MHLTHTHTHTPHTHCVSLSLPPCPGKNRLPCDPATPTCFHGSETKINRTRVSSQEVCVCVCGASGDEDEDDDVDNDEDATLQYAL